MPRGGRRTGTPGKGYANRSDLSKPMPVQAASGQTYGAKAEQMAAQRAIPMAGAPASVPHPPAAPPGAAGGLAAMLGGAQGAMPGEIRLDAPTTRPDEPVTAGVPVGAGPGPEALGPLAQAGDEQDAIMALRAAYTVYPSEDLRQILELIDLA